jgi:hypothetical protein
MSKPDVARRSPAKMFDQRLLQLLLGTCGHVRGSAISHRQGHPMRIDHSPWVGPSDATNIQPQRR